MKTELKIEKLQNLKEKSLREQVLVPLLAKMGFKAVTVYHGPRERGKDIVCFNHDHLGAREYLAIVTKTTDLDGSVSSSQGLREVMHQIEQCFDVTYEDLFGMTRVTMDRVWVVTSGKIVSGAADSIFDSLTKRNLSKLTRFIPGEVLVDLIDEHYPAYWDAITEPIDVLTEQKNRLVSFVKQLLLSLGGDASEIDATVNQVLHSSFPPTFHIPPDRSLSRVSPYSVEIDTISEPYSHGFYSMNTGVIKDSFFKIKDNVYHAMFDVDDLLENYEKFIKKSDPHEMISEFDYSLSEEYPFWNARMGSAADVFNDIDYLRDGLEDIDSLRKNLDKIGKLEWATALVDSVYVLEKEIKSFLSHVDKETFSLHWCIETKDGKGCLSLLYDEEISTDQHGISTKHDKTITYYKYGSTKQRTINVRDITDEVQSKLRDYLDAMLAKHGLECKE